MTKEDAAETALEDDQKSIIMGIIGQLRPGMDLTRITLPTFILEPKSMLERITNFMAHPEIVTPIPRLDDPVQRFVEVVRFYMAGWHIRPPGVKKPLNPILGEYFAGYWTLEGGAPALYVAEQVSHHPPISAYCYYCPEHNIRIDGVLKPRSKFLGNSAGSMMEGQAALHFLNHNETYTLTQPNMYARGILFGRMRMELGDHSFIRCEKTDLMADIEFKTKGFISGKYDTIGGVIKRIGTGEKLYEIEGKWNEQMTIKNLKTKKTETFFDATARKETAVTTKPVEQMGERESRRLWKETTDAIKARDQHAATQAKGEIEDDQREQARLRQERGESWKPRLFKKIGEEDYILDAPDGLSGEKLKQWMEESVGGITSQQASSTTQPQSQSPTKTTSAAPPQPQTTTQPVSSQPATAYTAAPAPGAGPHVAPQTASSIQTISSASGATSTQAAASATSRYTTNSSTSMASSASHQPQPTSSASASAPRPPDAQRPKLDSLDSEDQTFEDAQEHFADMSIR